jgi:hypothetical protein
VDLPDGRRGGGVVCLRAALAQAEHGQGQRRGPWEHGVKTVNRL